MIEIWKPVAGFDKYEVSNFGRVKSFWHKEPKILSPKLSKNGYLHVQLCAVDKRKMQLVHRLVAETFVPNPEGKHDVNHLDGCKTNNFVDNLEWVTRSENIQHAYDNGLSSTAENRYNAKLTNAQVEWCRAVYKPRDHEFGVAPLARKFGVAPTTIRQLIRGKTYKSLIHAHASNLKSDSVS